jgi:hypothetical protein
LPIKGVIMVVSHNRLSVVAAFGMPKFAIGRNGWLGP